MEILEILSNYSPGVHWRCAKGRRPLYLFLLARTSGVLVPNQTRKVSKNGRINSGGGYDRPVGGKDPSL